MYIVALPILLLVLFQVFRLRPFVRGTTAEGPHRWAIGAIVACILAAACGAGVPDVSPRSLSAIRYFASVMLLTPLVAILGARSPGSKAWGLFVVMPLVVILQWASASELTAINADTSVIIPTPTVVGFLFVLLMGAGNYFGTLNTESMVLGSVGVVLMLLPVTEYCSPENRWTFLAGCVCLLLSVYLVPRQFFIKSTSAEAANCNPGQLWRDFRDLYGIVWAKRVADRFNQFASREELPVEVTIDGFRRTKVKGAEPVAQFDQEAVEVPDRAIHILCWILRRFVPPVFLRRYLPDSMVRDDEKLAPL